MTTVQHYTVIFLKEYLFDFSLYFYYYSHPTVISTFVMTMEIVPFSTGRSLATLPAVLAPTKAAILPLVKKDGLPEIANKIIDDLRWDFNVAYDEKDAVGRRYRRQDALGTPFCITVDHQTIEDQTVTIRHRDTMKQDRVAIADLKSIIENEVSMKNWLMKM